MTLALVLALVAAAEAPAPCTGEAYRAFDFWLGEWQVHLGDGTFAGANTITARHDGCLLVERWRGASGGAGTSMNFYDPVSGRWRQVWVSPGVIIDIAGGLEAAAMALTGTITNTTTGETAAFRGRWTPLADGRVRQRFEQLDPAGAWQTWFDGYYSRAPAAGNDVSTGVPGPAL